VHNGWVRSRRFRRILILIGFLPLLCPLAAVLAQDAAPAIAADPLVVLAQLADVIHPITAEYVVDTLADAERRGASLFVLQIDTPGGLDSSMRDIIQAFLASPVPICLYVGPSGARAASAGFFMAMAADVVAMAPGTNMGAASPVAVGGAQPDETMAKKLMQDAEAYMRSLADQSGRPSDLAAEAVSDGRSFSAAEALAAGLADYLVDDFDALLGVLEGTRVRKAGRDIELRLEDPEIITVEPSLRQKILAIIANPQVAYMLMLMGLAGLYFELSTPGAILPGVLGGMSLVLALLAFQVLPISYAGLALIALAIVFFIIEIKVTSYGLLTIAGLVSFVLGSLMLVPGPIPEMRLQLSFVLPTALGVASLAAFLVTLVVRAHRSQVQTGPAGLVGESGTARGDLEPGVLGTVFVHGELWRARSDAPVAAGQTVEVTEVGRTGMELRVRPYPTERGE
jgi:membrane-bound serine protease (ClpP class)